MGDPNHLEKMGRELKCPICLSLLNSAVSLSCNHVFCNSCIVKSMKLDSNCPVCKVPFRRREIRAAPHMDNLVSIYKSMEVASGFNIFVTQNAPPSKSQEEKQAEDDMDNGIEKIDENSKHQRKLKHLRPRKCVKSNLEDSGPFSSQLSFPAKKRVQVPQHSLLEAPTCPEKMDVSIGENVEGGIIKRTCMDMKENPVLSGKGELVLSPFFWLRDEETMEKSSQPIDADQIIDSTPPHIPTFSEIKGSDDKDTSESSPTGEVCGKSIVGDTYDSEVFEWTQRPCSPELFSRPVKILVEDVHEDYRNQERISGASLLVELTNEKPSFVSEKFLGPVMLPNTINQIGHCQSDTKGESVWEATLKECAIKNVNRNFEAPVDAVVESESIRGKVTDENQDSIANLEKNRTRKKITHSRTENVLPPLKIGAVSLVDEHIASESPASSGNKHGGNKQLKKIEGLCTKIIAQGQGDHFLRSKKRSLKSAEVNSGEGIYPIPTQYNGNTGSDEPCSSAPKDDYKSLSAIKGKISKRGEVVELPLASKCNQNLRSKKKVKVSLNYIAEDTSVYVHPLDCGDASAMEPQETKSTANICNVSTNETQGIKRNDQDISRKLSQANGFALDKCKTPLIELQCAFCLSSEESEASGEMVHYYNGSPVVDSNGGAKVLHCHRNCAEWAPNVYFEDDCAINLEAELARSRRIKCCCCGLKGAALGCYEKNCRKSFHVPCAKLIPQCRWDNVNFVMLCPLHLSSKLPIECSGSQHTRIKKCIPERKTQDQSNHFAPKHDANTCQNWNSSLPVFKLVLCCSALTVEERKIVSELEKLSGARVVKKWDARITHVIASTDENGACRRTLKILMGIIEGKWILNVEWVKACLKAMKFVEEEKYEITTDIHGIRNGPRLGRLRLLNKQPKVFHGLNFYFMADFLPAYKGYMQELIAAAGGNILHRKPITIAHEAQIMEYTSPSTFIIYSLELPDKQDLSKRSMILAQRQTNAEALATSASARAVNNLWVLNSIAACKLQPLFE